MNNNTIQEQQGQQYEENQDPSNEQVLNSSNRVIQQPNTIIQQQQMQQEQSNQQQDSILSIDVLNQLIMGVREGLKADFQQLKSEIKQDVKGQLEDIDNKCINEIDNLRVQFNRANLVKRPYNQIARKQTETQLRDNVRHLQQQDDLKKVQQNDLGNLQNQSSVENAAINLNKGSSFGIPLVGSHSNAQNVENENQPISTEHILNEETISGTKRSIWAVSEKEIADRENMKRHIIIKFDKLKSRSTAVVALYSIGDYLRNKKVLPIKEPYPEELGADLSYKYVLEFNSIDDVKTFRAANKLRRNEKGNQGFKLDFHLTQQQKDIRAEIWSQFETYMIAKNLPMDRTNIQLVYTITTPWIIMGHNQPRITCEEFRTRTMHLGKPGDHGFIVQTFQPKRLKRNISDSTVNTIGDRPSPKFIDYLRKLYAEPPKKRARESEFGNQNGQQTFQSAHTNTSNGDMPQNANKDQNVHMQQSELNTVNVQNASQHTIIDIQMPNQANLQLRDIDPIILNTQEDNSHNCNMHDLGQNVITNDVDNQVQCNQLAKGVQQDEIDQQQVSAEQGTSKNQDKIMSDQSQQKQLGEDTLVDDNQGQRNLGVASRITKQQRKKTKDHVKAQKPKMDRQNNENNK